MLFSLFGLGRKIERRENPGENFLSRAHIFYAPKLGGKSERKSAFTALLHKYPLPSILIHDLMTLSPTPLDDFLPTNHPYHFFASYRLTFTNVQRFRFSSLFFFFFFPRDLIKILCLIKFICTLL